MNRARLLAARENKGVNEQIRSMSQEIGNLQANINYQTDQANRSYNTELKNQDRQDRLSQQNRQNQLQNFQLYVSREDSLFTDCR